MKEKIKGIFDKIKDNKGKIAIGSVLVALIFNSGLIKVNPLFKEAMNDQVTAVKEQADVARERIIDVLDPLPPKDHEVVPESDRIGVTIYLNGKRHRLIISKTDRDKLLNMQERNEPITENVISSIEKEDVIHQYKYLKTDSCATEHEKLEDIENCMNAGIDLSENYD